MFTEFNYARVSYTAELNSSWIKYLSSHDKLIIKVSYKIIKSFNNIYFMIQLFYIHVTHEIPL